MDLSTNEHLFTRFRNRLLVAGAFVLLCFGLIVARFSFLQITRHEYYSTRAESNRISLVPITPNRGLIYDRNGLLLARNYSAYTLEIWPAKVADVELTINALSNIIDIEARDRKRFQKLLEENGQYDSIPIRTKLSDEEVAKFIAQRYRFPGVEIQARLFRQYPETTLASHAIGYIGRINNKEQERIKSDEQVEANYRGTDYIGKAGLEQHYENSLHGTTGFEEVEVDASGRLVRSLSSNAPTPGKNLILTLDAKLQQIAERAFGDRRGSLVAIEPGTGGILALVSVPGYDPNLFVDGIDQHNWDLLNNSIDHPMLNRALNSAYPPGSTFKPFMALAALTNGKRTPTQTIMDPGYFWFGNHKFRDDKEGGHGLVDMVKSIVVSCDTYYYMLANDMGIDMIANFMAQFGFGSRTGIDIEGESSGILPSPEWKKNRFRRYGREQQKWYPGETVSIGIGQGYNAYTPIQLAHATATLAAGGVMFKPHLVKYIEDPVTHQKETVEPRPIKTIPLDPAHLEVIKRAMIGVNLQGTGARAFAGTPYQVAGKTGTAQLFSLKGQDYREKNIHDRLRDHALYIAYAPADNPKIAVAVLVENGGFGAQAAAPIARQIFDYYLLGIEPKGPAVENANEAPND